jgi:PAS domain S-box-containing protein
MDAAAKFPWLEPFEAAASPIWLRNSKSILLWVNDAFAASTHHARKELIGSKIADWLPDERKRSEALTRKVITSRSRHNVIRSVKIDDAVRWFEIHHEPVPPERTAGHGWCVLASAVDVTDNVQMAALRLLLGLRKRDARKLDDGDERFVRLLLHGTTIRGISSALQLSVAQVTNRLSALAGTPLG